MFPRKPPCRLPAFLAVWRSQRSTEVALVDLKSLAAPAIVVCLLTILRSEVGVGRWLVLIFCLVFISWAANKG